MEKDNKIKKELEKLREIFADIPPSKKALCEKLMQNAAFMAVTLEELQERINEEGAIIVARNGNGFDITQEHPAQRSYIAMIAKYSSVINQLSGLLPDSKTDGINKAGEALAAFVAKGKPVELR